jgi:hypothetical protein
MTEKKKYEPIPGMGKLAIMFNVQSMFQKKLGIDIVSMTMTQRQKYIKDMVLYATKEQFELLDCINYKEYKKTQKEVDVEHALEEIVDSQCFLINQVLGLGKTEEEFFQCFMRKVAINNERQDKNY